jgi:hypothetical protein
MALLLLMLCILKGYWNVFDRKNNSLFNILIELLVTLQMVIVTHKFGSPIATKLGKVQNFKFLPRMETFNFPNSYLVKKDVCLKHLGNQCDNTCVHVTKIAQLLDTNWHVAELN